uniref:Uncharacterized protein n=1 Tax=Sphaerodactylus townsendi TaxID=933632 RepID=A0ACB8G198_9SAUR
MSSDILASSNPFLKISMLVPVVSLNAIYKNYVETQCHQHCKCALVQTAFPLCLWLANRHLKFLLRCRSPQENLRVQSSFGGGGTVADGDSVVMVMLPPQGASGGMEIRES